MNEQEQITPIEQYIIDYILTLRAEKKLSQQDIADIVGVSRSFIGDVEGSTKPSKYNVRHINALADYFGISPREFLPEKAFPVDGVEEKVVRKASLPIKKKIAPAKAVKKAATPKRKK
ncbi:MAG: helix-turn-helix transcriptional regulator [Niastella sp.]|nr:helix-turn-helix transcriptional regulator [Niastella sp.]